MTKKELLEAIKDMPEDAEVFMEIYDYGLRCYKAVEEIEFWEPVNEILLC